MGLGDVGKWIKKKAKQGANWIEDEAEDIADWIDSKGDEAKEKAEEIAEAVEDNVPYFGGVLGGACRLAGELVSEFMDLAATGVKAAGSTMSGIVGGGLLIIGGILDLDLDAIKEGIKAFVLGISGGVLVAGGKVISMAQDLFRLQARKRKLTKTELAVLEVVFHDSVNYEHIWIVEGNSGVFSFNDRPFVVGNVIYMKNVSASDWDKSLVHETTHVWQYQNLGASYASEALAAQAYYEYVVNADAYHWYDPDVNGGSMKWEDWNPEAQATFIEDVFQLGQSTPPGGPTVSGNGCFFAAQETADVGYFEYAGVDYTPDAERTVAILWAGGV